MCVYTCTCRYTNKTDLFTHKYIHTWASQVAQW